MLTIIVPVYNEEPAIPGFHEQMTGAMDKSGIAYELLYVNDGSTDCTEQLLSTLGAKVVHLERNMGYGAAIKVGIKIPRRRRSQLSTVTAPMIRTILSNL